MRNKKYGERTLSLLREKNKTLILEIDPPEDDISKRRKAFYQRCGFSENLFKFIHPPYHKEGKGFPLEIMTYPKHISKDIFDTFSTYHKNKVMKNVYS